MSEEAGWFKRGPYNSALGYGTSTPLWHLYDHYTRQSKDEKYPKGEIHARCGYVFTFPWFLHPKEAATFRLSVKTEKLCCTRCWKRWLVLHPELVKAPKRAQAVTGYRWVACSAKEFGSVGETRHLIPVGREQIDTMCNCSATSPGVWRGNTTKPKCIQCVVIESKMMGRIGS